MNLRNYSIFFLLLIFFACKKESDTPPLQPSPNELLNQKWKPQTRQVLEKGYDNAVHAQLSAEVWNFQGDGAFLRQTCGDCPAVLDGNWTLSADKKKLTVVSRATNASIEYSIVSITATRLVVQAIDLIGACGIFDTTGEPGWVAPPCPKGLVQYELTPVK